MRRCCARSGTRGRPDAVDRLVLLGDVLELRGGPVRTRSRPRAAFFEALGEALDGRELLLLSGNHDHAIVAPWLERRDGAARAWRSASSRASRVIHRGGARRLPRPSHVGSRSPTRAAWLRDDVYAMHGHYLDRHVTVPSLERIGIGAMARLIGAGAPATSRARRSTRP